MNQSKDYNNLPTDEDELDDFSSNDLSEEILELNKTLKNQSKDDGKTNLPVPVLCQILACCVFVILAIVLPYIQFIYKSETLPKKCNELNSMRLHNPNQDLMFWSSIEIGVDNVLNKKPSKPSTFLFVYENYNDFDKFINNITTIIKKCLDNNYEPIIISGNEFNFTLKNDEVNIDYGMIISKYESLLKNSGLLIVNDLNYIPANLIPAFHVFCDHENPLVDEAIIIFTMKLTNKNLTIYNYNNAVDDYLREIWGESLDNNLLEPLITRITDQVLYLK